MHVSLIGHGSLMSGRGLSFSGRLRVRRAWVAALRGCRRGFAKLSVYGDRFATDLKLGNTALEADWRAPASTPDERVETLGLQVSPDDCLRLAKREGYRPAAFQSLAERAQADGLGVAEWLWRIAAEHAHEPHAYRSRLFALTGYTSPHYIPHPVRLHKHADGSPDYALLFLAPGRYGTGSPDVTSVRQQTGIETILDTSEAWRRKPNDDQLAYFVWCLLAGVHGINVRDLLAGVAPRSDLAQRLAERVQAELAAETEYFLDTTGLSRTDYERAFGKPEAALRRSGLGEFLGAGRTG